MRPLVTLSMLLLTLISSSSHANELPPAQDFLPAPDQSIQADDYLILRGRFRNCIPWDGRILEIHDLAASTKIRPLGMREMDVEGLKVIEVYERIRKLLKETFPFEETPLVTVESRSLESVTWTAREFIRSREAWKRGECPTSPPKSPDWWPRGGPETKRDIWDPVPYPVVPPPKDDPLYRSLAFREGPRSTAPAA